MCTGSWALRVTGTPDKTGIEGTERRPSKKGASVNRLATLVWILSFVLLVPFYIALPKAATVVAYFLLMEMPTPLLRTPWVIAAIEYSYYPSAAIVLLLSGAVIASAEQKRRAARIVLPITFLLIIAWFVAGYLAVVHQ